MRRTPSLHGVVVKLAISTRDSAVRGFAAAHLSLAEGRLALGIGVLAALIILAGCQDEIAAPTQGHLFVETGGVDGVRVFVDDVLAGAAPGIVGPIDAGMHTVRVEKEFYDIAPSSQSVAVAVADTLQISFDFVLIVAGSARVTSEDEVMGGELTGAEILREESPGVFVPTGLLTPATLEGLEPGPLTLQVRAPGYAPSTPVQVTVVESETVAAQVLLGPERHVMADMFTYVACPNCPLAVAKLEGIVEDDDDFFFIEWHTRPPPPVLPFYDPRWQERHDLYRRNATRQWPAVVFQGGYLDTPSDALIIGAEASELALYEARVANYLSECSNDCPIAMVAIGEIDAAEARIEAHFSRRSGALPAGPLDLAFVIVEDEVPLGITRYSHVARERVQQELILPAEGQRSQVSVTIPVGTSWNVSRLNFVVYVQARESYEILAVDGSRR
jgi:hypothetical protein